MPLGSCFIELPVTVWARYSIIYLFLLWSLIFFSSSHFEHIPKLFTFFLPLWGLLLWWWGSSFIFNCLCLLGCHFNFKWLSFFLKNFFANFRMLLNCLWLKLSTTSYRASNQLNLSILLNILICNFSLKGPIFWFNIIISLLLNDPLFYSFRFLAWLGSILNLNCIFYWDFKHINWGLVPFSFLINRSCLNFKTSLVRLFYRLWPPSILKFSLPLISHRSSFSLRHDFPYTN